MQKLALLAALSLAGCAFNAPVESRADLNAPIDNHPETGGTYSEAAVSEFDAAFFRRDRQPREFRALRELDPRTSRESATPRASTSGYRGDPMPFAPHPFGPWDTGAEPTDP